jgi:hypothetical protein
MKWPRRFCCQQSSVSSVQNGCSSPLGSRCARSSRSMAAWTKGPIGGSPGRGRAPSRRARVSRRASRRRGAGRGRRGSPARAARPRPLDHAQLLVVTSLKYGMRDDRHADAGSSHVGRPARATARGSRPWSGRPRRAGCARRTRGPPAARAVVAAIVGVAAVGDAGDPARARQRRQVRVELVLAVVAAVGGLARYSGRDISPVRMISWRGRTRGRSERELAVAFGIARAVGGDAQRRGPSTGWRRRRGRRCPRRRCTPRSATEVASDS